MIRFIKRGIVEETFESRYDVVLDLAQSASPEYGDDVIAWLYGSHNNELLTIDDETWETYC